MEAVYVIGILILVVGIGFGFYRGRTRNKANDPIREEAVKQLYDDPKAYEDGGKQKLQNQLKSES